SLHTTSPTASYPPTLHDALPILSTAPDRRKASPTSGCGCWPPPPQCAPATACRQTAAGTRRRMFRHHRLGRLLSLRMSLGCRRRSEEHTSELQSRENLVCRLLLE